MDEATEISTASSQLKDLSINICSREQFFRLGDPTVDPKVIEQLQNRISFFTGKYVIYDPQDDKDGFLLVGDDLPTMVQETFDHFRVR